MHPLPVDAALPALIEALATAGAAVLIAPPGAGKSTRVPPALLDAGIVEGKALLLQPRRVAARLVARRMAAERGQAVGADIGWHIRHDRQVGPTTRIEVLTEGLLTRRLQADPLLEGVGLVILDEFHERSLHADLALALLAEVRREVRPDLKLLVMSATLDPEPVAAYLGGPVVRAEGRVFPVEITYDPRPDDRPIAVRCAAAIRRVLAATTGHVLAFLPGVGEIDRTAEALSGVDATVVPLHGSLPPDAQDRALAPMAGRKVVLATNLAETSVTLEGVEAVVDTGLHRTPVYDPAADLTRLLLAPISRASADQRAGRAGRTGPGRCHRLWTEAEHTHRPAAEVPEIQRADLARTALEVRGWGADPKRFRWFAPPPASAWSRAEAGLCRLGALDGERLTAIGRQLLALPIEPRLARIVLAGHAAGRLEEVATAAALMSERDVLRDLPEMTGDSDLDLRFEALGRGGLPANPGAVREVRQARDQLMALARGALGAEPRPGAADLIDCLLTGLPDRVARRRAPRSERFKLADGSGATLDQGSVVRDAEWILALTLDGGARGTEHRIRLAVALAPRRLPTSPTLTTRFDPEREAVVQTRQHVYRPPGTDERGLVVREEPVQADPAAIATTLAAAVAADPRRALTFTPEDERLIARIAWLASRRPDLGLPELAGLTTPSPTPTPLIEALCTGHRSFADLRTQPLGPWLRRTLSRDALTALDRLAPATLDLPDGTTARLEYGEPTAPPVLAARIQQLFGLPDTPRAAGEPVLLHLLSPGNRPVQITRDLKGFWANSYFDVRKDLRGRYPKHPWPDDPLAATATSRAKPRGT